MRRAFHPVCALLIALAGCTDAASDNNDPPVSRDDATMPADVNDTELPTFSVSDSGTTVALPSVCDAGDDAWVARTLPLLWGRRAHGAAEIQYWSQMASEHGRETVVRAMALDPAYTRNWSDWFTDALIVARSGDKEFADCYASPLLDDHDGSLAHHIRSSDPATEAFPSTFNMADVIRDALAADDVSVIYQAHLLARMARPVLGANVSAEELEFNRRVSFGETFMRTYLNRNMVCLTCHNSEFSLTDHSDPARDLTWQLPGYFEQALFAYNYGRSADEVYAMFRHEDVADGDIRPWRMDDDCGELEPPGSQPDDDFIGQQISYFIEEYDARGTVWDVERSFVAGADALAGLGLQVGVDSTVGGSDAFAYLTATSIATDVWRTATGSPLVLTHHFSRNEGQMTRLKTFADTLASTGFSLQELLIAVTSDPYYNPGLPSTCDADPYGLDPIFDPFTVAEDDESRQGNGPGDAVHRLTARTLIRSAHQNLDWKPRQTWFESSNDDEEDFQAAIGVFLRESQPGFNGSDFQGLLAFEAEYGLCRRSASLPEGDFLSRLLAAADGATVGDVATAVKDRIMSSSIAADEQALVEDLLGLNFADVVPASDPAFEEGIRLYCGTLLLSPQFQLLSDASSSAIPALALDREADCTSIASLMNDVGASVQCTGTVLQAEMTRSSAAIAP